MSESILTGVVNGHGVEWLHDEVYNAISLDAEEVQRAYDAGELSPEDMQAWDDGLYEFYDETLLIGQWRKDEDSGQWVPDVDNPAFEYAAIWSCESGSIVQVVASRWIARVRSMCSPCYPGQADLDSGRGDILAYALPADMYGDCKRPHYHRRPA